MLRKIRLKRNDAYAVSVIAKLLSETIRNYILGNKCHKCIGSEIGTIKDWDDIVIKKNDGTYTYIQVKNQHSAFCTKEIERATGQELSELDKVINSLANLKEDELKNKTFELIVPTDSLTIKKNLNLHTLQEICDDIKDGTTAYSLESSLLNISKYQNCYIWLRKWCGIRDCNHLLKILSVFKIQVLGNQSDIDNYSIKILSYYFNTPHDVLAIIKNYITEQESCTSCILPRNILLKLKCHISNNIPKWTLYKQENNIWHITGINDLRHDTEESSTVIPNLWQPKNECKIYLASSKMDANIEIIDALQRLIIHQPNISSANVINKDLHIIAIKNKVGNTLGNENKEELDNLNIQESDRFPQITTNKRTLLTSREQREEALKMEETMTKITWQCVIKKVFEKIEEIPTDKSTELKDKVEELWNIWISEIGENINEINALFTSIVYPNAERKNIKSNLRIGLKTSELLANAIYLLLIISVSIGDKKSKWNEINKNLSLKVIGLFSWSGSSEATIKFRPIDRNIDQIIGKETASILGFSKIRQYSEQITNNNLACNSINRTTIASPNFPYALITLNPKLEDIIEQGEIKPIHDYIKNIILRYKIEQEKAIQEAI